MRIRITGRHVVITQALKDHIHGKVERLERYGLRIMGVQVVLGVEKYRHLAEAIVNVNGVAVQGKAATRQMSASIDQVLDKISRQLQKRKAKLTDHRPGHLMSRRPRAAREHGRETNVHTVRPFLESLTIGQAIGRLTKEPSALVVFFNPSSNRVQVIHRTQAGSIELVDPLPADTSLG